MALGSTQPLSEMSTRKLSGGKGLTARKSDGSLVVSQSHGPPRPVTKKALPLPLPYQGSFSDLLFYRMLQNKYLAFSCPLLTPWHITLLQQLIKILLAIKASLSKPVEPSSYHHCGPSQCSAWPPKLSVITVQTIQSNYLSFDRLLYLSVSFIIICQILQILGTI
jgi:hypothetical protein